MSGGGGAVPKRKVSRSRRDMRRAANSELSKPAFTECRNCGELTHPHHICLKCGYYRGRRVIEGETTY